MGSYKRLQCPTVGVFEKDVSHTQIEPSRSVSNIHDDYTPIYVEPGTQSRTYSNKCHGWNLLRLAFENNLPVIVFDDNIRNNKKHYYPESETDFYKHKKYIDYKFNYCKEEFVHMDNTESKSKDLNEKYQQLVLPASGTLYLDLIDSGRVIFYDYNLKALDYWKTNLNRKENIEYIFVHTDLLKELTILDYIDPKLNTLVNLSNIFSYEGTVARYSLYYRLTAQNLLVESLKNKIKNVKINFTQEIKLDLIDRLTWHY